MKRKLLYLVSLLSLVCIQSVKGQTITQIDWSKYASVIDDVITTDETNPIYILLWDYTIGTNDAFLTNGGTYGMQGTISNIGNRFYITKNGDHYLIHSNTNNPLGEALGNCMSVNFFNSPFGEKDDFGCMTVISGTDIFMDRGGVKNGSEDGKAHTASMPNWDFYKFDKNNSYWICNTDIRGDKGTGEIKVDSYGWADDNNGYRALYISGGMTNWDEPGKGGSIKMTTADYVNYTAEVTFSNSDFKIYCGKGWDNAEYGALDEVEIGLGTKTLGKNKDVSKINNIKTSLTGTYTVSFNIETKVLTISEKSQTTTAETAAAEVQERANAALYIDQNADGKPLSYSAKDGVSHLWCIITEKNYREVVRNVRDNSYVDVSGIVRDGGFKRFNVHEKDWKPLDKDNNALGDDKLDGYGSVTDLIEGVTTSNAAYNLNKGVIDETMKNLLGYKPYLIGGALLEKNIRDKYRTYGEATSGDVFDDWNKKKQPWEFWKKYGDDFCAGIYCNGGYRQEITGLIKGTYHVKCTAFATNGGSGMLRIKANNSGDYKTVAFKVLDTGGEAAFNGKKSGVVRDARRHLWLAPVIEPEATTAETESSANPLAGLDYYYQGLDIIAAAQLLEEEKGKYTIEVEMELTEADNNTLTIEFWNMQTDDPLAKPVFVDNIQVFYEDVKYVTYISANQADYNKVDKYEYTEAVDLYVRRAFTEDKWNSIVLPFDITTANVVSAFGDGAVLSKLEGINPDRSTQIRFNKTEKLEAGECGLVFVPKGAKENHATCKENTETTQMKMLTGPITKNPTDADYWDSMQSITNYFTFAGPLYNFGKVKRSRKGGDPSYTGYVTFSVDGGNVRDKGVVSKNYTTAVGTLEYEGYYCKPKKDGNNESWPGQSYIVYDGDMYHLSSDWGVKYATMWYLKDPQNKSMSRTFVINGIADNTVTEISGVVIDNGMAETGRIYNLNGQYMGDNASKDNLPKGLYIMNGKKFIVR